MKTKVLTRVTMMVALMIVSGVLTIPLPGLPVPIVLQNMMMMLAGGLLGKKYGPLAVSVFLLMVAVGFPVLSGGRGGIAIFASASGGFLLGYVLAPLVIGYLLEKNWEKLTFAKAVLIFIVGGALLIDFFGSFSMAYYMGNSWLNGLKMTMAFVPLDTVKAILAAWITLRLKKRYSLISMNLA